MYAKKIGVEIFYHFWLLQGWSRTSKKTSLKSILETLHHWNFSNRVRGISQPPFLLILKTRSILMSIAWNKWKASSFAIPHFILWFWAGSSAWSFTAERIGTLGLSIMASSSHKHIHFATLCILGVASSSRKRQILWLYWTTMIKLMWVINAT